jgi:hypothetical protein
MAMSIFPGYDLDRAAKIFKPVRARVLRKWPVPFRVMPALLANCLCGKSKTVNPRNFFAELKRRNVYKVAVGYAVVGWLVMQVAATVVPALHMPDAITTAVVGNRNEALNWLEQGYREHDGFNIGPIRIDPLLASLHGDPPFEAFAEKIIPAREFAKAATSSK